MLSVRSLVRDVRRMRLRAVARHVSVSIVLGSIAMSVLAAPIQRMSLIGRSEGPCVAYDCLQEFLYPLPEPVRRGEGVFLVRIDSDLPLTLAIATASVPPSAVADWMGEYYNFNPVNVLVGRARPSIPTAARYAGTEVWWAASRDELPATLDVVHSNQIVIDRIGVRPKGLSRLPFEGAPDYVGAIHQLVKELRRRPNALGVVNGYYLDRTTKAMSRRLGHCERLLASSGLDRRRFVVRHIRWPGEWSDGPPDPRPVRPSVFLYEILPEGPVSIRARSNYRVQRSAHS
jgi:hypothetical protein